MAPCLPLWKPLPQVPPWLCDSSGAQIESTGKDRAENRRWKRHRGFFLCPVWKGKIALTLFLKERMIVACSSGIGRISATILIVTLFAIKVSQEWLTYFK